MKLRYLAIILGVSITSCLQSAPPSDSGDHSALLSQGKSTIETVSQMTENIMKSTSPDAQKKEDLLSLFQNYFNVPAIAKHVLRIHWKRATAEEKKSYVTLFEQDIVNTYFNLLKRYYHKNKLTVLKAEPSKRHPQACDVISKAQNPDNAQEVTITWQLFNNRVLDVLVDKASMSNAKYQDYREMIRKHGGTMDGFLKALQEKIQKQKFS